MTFSNSGTDHMDMKGIGCTAGVHVGGGRRKKSKISISTLPTVCDFKHVHRAVVRKLLEREESCGESRGENDKTLIWPGPKGQKHHLLLGTPLLRKSKGMAHGYHDEAATEDTSNCKMTEDVIILESISGTNTTGLKYKEEALASSSSKTSEDMKEKRVRIGPGTHPRMTLQRVREILGQVKATLRSRMGGDLDIKQIPAKCEHIPNVDREVLCKSPSKSEDEELMPTSLSIVFQPADNSRTQATQLKKSSTNSLRQANNDHLAGKGKSKGKASTSEKKEKNVPDKEHFLSHSPASKSGHKRQLYGVRKDRYIQSGRVRTGLKFNHDQGVAYLEGPSDEKLVEIQSVISPMQSSSKGKAKTYCVRDSKGRYRKVISKLQPAEEGARSHGRKCKKVLVCDSLSMTTSSTSRDSNRAGRCMIDINEPFHPIASEEGSGTGFCSSEAMQVTKEHKFPKDGQSFRNFSRVQPVTHSFSAEKARKRKKRKMAAVDLPTLKYTPDIRICPGSMNRIEDWNPPVSPIGLVQERCRQDAWKVLLSSMLLNKATGRPVEKIIWELFELCPDAESAVKMETKKIADIIFSLGLQNKRAKMIQRFSSEYLRGEWINVAELHGIGKYATDSYAIFYQGLWREVEPDDPTLTKYWNWIQQLYGLEGSLLSSG